MVFANSVRKIPKFIFHIPTTLGGEFWNLKCIICWSFFCLPFLLNAQALLNQRIDFEIQDMPISDALIELSEIADINIAFHPRLFSKEDKVSLSLKNQPLQDILTACLAKTKVTFKVEGSHLILFEKPKQYYTLSGYLEDATTGERLVAAAVWEHISGKGTTTNDYGFFSIKLEEGHRELHYSYLGYQEEIQSFQHTKAKKLTIPLKPSITLEEIIITDNEFEAQQAHITLGKGTSLPLQKMQTQIALAGESDILRYMNTLASVQSGADGIGGLQVRGGNSDQNLVLMDGVPVYNPSHTLGLFSIFNTQIIKNAQLLKGNFSAKYAGRLSSVMDIRVKEGNNKEWTGTAEIGTLASKLTIEGPLNKNKTGLLIAARRTHIDPFIRNISQRRKAENLEEGQIDYHFSDFNAKLHHRFSNKDQLFLSYYTGEDSFKDTYFYEEDFEEEEAYYYYYEQDQNIDWGNQITALRWNHLFHDRLFSNTTFTFSNYKYSSANVQLLYEELDGFTELDDYYFTDFSSNIKDGGIKIDFEYYPTAQHQVLFGAGFLVKNFTSGIVSTLLESYTDSINITSPDNFDEVYQLPSFKATEFNAYLEDKIQFSNQLSLMAGVHLAAFFTQQKLYLLPQPRASLLWKFAPKWQMLIAGSRMAQFLHILSTSGSGFPNDLWVPSTPTIRPQEAWQLAWTTTHQPTKEWKITFDAFYKKYQHLISYQDASALPSLYELDPDFWEEDANLGEGHSYGASATIEKKKGPLTGLVNYAYTVSERQFANTNNGQPYPFRYNHPHEVKIITQYQLSTTASFNLSWQYGSGQPYSLLTTNTPFAPLNNLASPESTETMRIGSVNSHRLPAYHRLDLGFYFHWQRPKVTHHLNLGIYNIYDRKNPYYIYLYEDEFDPEESGRRQQNGLPILPSVFYRIVF